MGDRVVPVGGRRPPEGEGFLSFLGKLEWIRDAELENTSPFDTEKLRTPHVAYISVQGIKLASFLHFTGIGMSLSLLSLSYLLPKLLFLFLLTELYFLAIKVAVPVWLIRKFVTFEKGLSTEMIKFYVMGYVFFSIFVDVLSLGLGAIAYLFMLVFVNVGFSFYDERIYPILSFFLNLKTLSVFLLNLLSDPIPMVYFYLFRKKRKESIPPWVPLDSVPKER